MSRHASLVLGAVTLMGCIIPRAPDYEVPANTPAVVRGRTPTPQSEIIRVDRDSAEAVTISFEIEDPDVEQVLSALAYINFDYASTERPLPVQSELTIMPNLDGEQPQYRNAEITLLVSSFPTTNCHSVEIRVNEDYERFPPRPPNADDEGIGTWIVALFDESDPFPDISECPSNLSGSM